MIYNQMVTWTAFAILAVTVTVTETETETETETGSMIEMAEQDCYLVPRLLIFVQGGVDVRKEILYKNLRHCLETLKKSNDSADVPLVDDDVLVILAHKVILACFSTYRHTHKYD